MKIDLKNSLKIKFWFFEIDNVLSKYFWLLALIVGDILLGNVLKCFGKSTKLQLLKA